MSLADYMSVGAICHPSKQKKRSLSFTGVEVRAKFTCSMAYQNLSEHQEYYKKLAETIAR